MTAKQKNVWILVLGFATVQVSIALLAVQSSNENILSDMACYGGIFGTLVNLVILSVVLIGSLILAIKSFVQKTWNSGLKPLSFLVLSSTVAIFIGQYAMLRCTV